MKTNTAVRLAGSKFALAKILGIDRSAVSQWGDSVPVLRVFQLKVLRPEWFARS